MLIVIFALEQFCRGRAIVAIIDRDEHKGEDEQADHSGQFPPGKQQHLIAIHANQLVRREIGQRDRAGDKIPTQAAIREEVIMVRPAIAGGRIAAAEIGQKPDHSRNEKEYSYL